MKYNLTPVRVTIIRKTEGKCGQGFGKRKHLRAVDGNLIWYSPYGKRIEIPQEIDNRARLGGSAGWSVSLCPLSPRKQGCVLSPSLSNTVLETLASASKSRGKESR